MSKVLIFILNYNSKKCFIVFYVEQSLELIISKSLTLNNYFVPLKLKSVPPTEVLFPVKLIDIEFPVEVVPL